MLWKPGGIDEAYEWSNKMCGMYTRQSADCMHDAYSTLHIDGLAQGCSNSIALAIESLQSCT